MSPRLHPSPPTSELAEPRTVLVVGEDGPAVMSMIALDTDTGMATVQPLGSDRWFAAPVWRIVDPRYDMLVDRDEFLAGKIDLATDAAHLLSALEVTVLDVFDQAGGEGLTNDALHRRLADAGVGEFDLSITPKVVADHLASARVETLPVPERSRRTRREPAHVRRITGFGRLVVVERRLAPAVPS